MRYLIIGFSLLVAHGAFAQTAEPAATMSSEQASVPDSAGPRRFSVGTGMEMRAQQEVNPQMMESRFLPHFFVQYRLTPLRLGLALEGGFEERDTSSGALKIESRSVNVGLWGRYEFLQPLRWSPFLALGAGSYFDTVKSKFYSESDERSGRRDFFGLGGGLSTAVWDHLLLEAEMRAALIQDRKDIAYSGIVRIGFVL